MAGNEPTVISLRDEMAKAFLGRHYDNQESDTEEIRTMMYRLKQVVAEVHH